MRNVNINQPRVYNPDPLVFFIFGVHSFFCCLWETEIGVQMRSNWTSCSYSLRLHAISDANTSVGGSPVGAIEDTPPRSLDTLLLILQQRLYHRPRRS